MFTIYSLKDPHGATFWESLIKAQTHLLKKKKKKKHKNPKQIYAAKRKREPTKRTIEKELQSAQMMEREKSEKKVRICHHQTTVPSTGIVSVFLYRRPVYSLHIQILFLQFERLKLLTIAFPIRIRILNLQYFYVFEFKTGSSPYLIFYGSSFTLSKKKKNYRCRIR